MKYCFEFFNTANHIRRLMVSCLRKFFSSIIVATRASIIIMLFIFSVNSVWAETVDSIQTEKLQLVFQSESNSNIRWEVQATDSLETEQWKSLLTRDHTGRLLSRHLSLDGIKISNGSSEKSKETNEIIYAGLSGSDRLTVRKLIKNACAYSFVLQIEIKNTSHEVVELKDDVLLVLGPGLGEYPSRGFGVAETMYSFVEPVVSVDGTIGKIKEFVSKKSSQLQYDWFGLHSRYFALLLSPLEGYIYNKTDINFHYLDYDYGIMLPDRYLPLLTINLNIRSLKPGQTLQREFLIFSGPKSTTALKADNFDFSGILFFGIWPWVALLCSIILWLLTLINGLVSNWGISIILLAVLVRLGMYPFARKVLSSQKAFAEVQKLIQPEMQTIKETYLGGEQSEKILELYKRHGVSPFAGLKPLLIVLIQLPIFIALFHVLGRAFELRAASFLWIETLAEPDRLFNIGLNLPFFGEYFNVLPVFMAGTTLLTIKLSPAPSVDKSSSLWQKIFLIIIALGFFLIFYPFPSGMVLYWTMSNVLHLLQQFIVEKMQTKV